MSKTKKRTDKKIPWTVSPSSFSGYPRKKTAPLSIFTPLLPLFHTGLATSTSHYGYRCAFRSTWGPSSTTCRKSKIEFLRESEWTLLWKRWFDLFCRSTWEGTSSSVSGAWNKPNLALLSTKNPKISANSVSTSPWISYLKCKFEVIDFSIASIIIKCLLHK